MGIGFHCLFAAAAAVVVVVESAKCYLCHRNPQSLSLPFPYVTDHHVHMVPHYTRNDWVHCCCNYSNPIISSLVMARMMKRVIFRQLIMIVAHRKPFEGDQGRNDYFGTHIIFLIIAYLLSYGWSTTAA